MNTTEEPGAEAAPVNDASDDAPSGVRADTDDAETRGEPDVEPVTPPEGVVADAHDHALDDDEDARFLAADDPRRQEVEQRLHKRFDDDQGEGDTAEDEGETAQDAGDAPAEQGAGVDDGEGGGEQEVE